MRIINIVDSVEKINYGIWHAATANAGLLADKDIVTELWYPEIPFDVIANVTSVPLRSLSLNGMNETAEARELNPDCDIIITHGAWSYATRWGAGLKKKGFRWIYVPHGMLDPWALRQKRIKKALYFSLIEKRLAKKADLIKAVSLTESISLKAFFDPSLVVFIPNGVPDQIDHPDFQLKQHPRRFLFLSRLHPKKNVLTLAAAWLQSSLNNNSSYQLIIAGPDQGELEKLKPLLQQSENIHFAGSVYDNKKHELLQQCTFYVLPSFSEGLPTALLEAMSYGLIPVITEHCNLPEVFTQNLGVRITTEKSNIVNVLEQTADWPLLKIKEISLNARQFVKDHYSLEAITKMQADIFLKLFQHPE